MTHSRGVIAKLKARIQSRRGASVWEIIVDDHFRGDVCQFTYCATRPRSTVIDALESG